MEIRETFATRLKLLRDENLLSLAELAKKIGVSSVSLGHYERQARVPDIEMLGRIAEYFNVTTDYLLGYSNNRTIENINIGAVTGLTDISIETLKQLKNKNLKNYLNAINIIIEDSFEYRYSFNLDTILETDIFKKAVYNHADFLLTLWYYIDTDVESGAAAFKKLFYKTLSNHENDVLTDALGGLDIGSLENLFENTLFEEIKKGLIVIKNKYKNKYNPLIEASEINEFYSANPQYKEEYDKKFNSSHRKSEVNDAKTEVNDNGKHT